jgi:hypothetical protein
MSDETNNVYEFGGHEVAINGDTITIDGQEYPKVDVLAVNVLHAKMDVKLLFAVVQDLHDNLVRLIEDLGSKNFIDASKYIADEAVTFDAFADEPPFTA